MNEEGSLRQILRSSTIIGGASVISLTLGVLRIKAAALLLGPSGVGLIGLLTSLAETTSNVVSLGIGNAGTRQIAEATGRQDGDGIDVARRALFWCALVLALAGGVLTWSFRDVLAAYVMNDVSLGGDVGWLAIAVMLSVAATSQTAFLNGLRQIGDLGRLTMFSAVLSTFLGISALLVWGQGGLMAFIISGPLASFVLGYLYVSRVPRSRLPPSRFSVLTQEWRVLLPLGVAFMMAGLATTLGQLFVRTVVQRQLGTEALGYFQAASTISMTYIAYVLAALGADYFPRLTAAINDHTLANRMVNEQTEVSLLLAGPVLLVMMGLAPMVIELLYSRDFHPAGTVLRWQVLGDVLKVASWPLGFIVMAAGDWRKFMLAEFLAMAVFVSLTLIYLEPMGIAATGVAFLGMYIVYLPMIYVIARQKTGFRWTPAVKWLIGGLFFASILVILVAQWSASLGSVVGLLSGVVSGAYSAGRLARKSNLDSICSRGARRFRQWLMKIGVWRA